MVATPSDDATAPTPGSDGGRAVGGETRAARAGGGASSGGAADRRAAQPPDIPPPPGYSSHLARRITMMLVCAGGTGVIAHVALSTRRGQAVDTMSMESAMTWHGALGPLESVIEGIVSVPAVVVVSVLVVVVALLRRRPTLAGRAIVMVAGANATTQVMQAVLDRPDLGVATVVPNSLPSGHATVAASVALALVMIAPAWFREPAAWIGWVWASLTGVTVMVSAWHRPSDVVTALLVCGAWALALAPLESRERHARGAQRVMGVVAAVCVALGVVGTVASTAGLDLQAVAAPGGELGNYGFADFLAQAGWRTRLLAVSASLSVVGVVGLVIHEVDRLSWA